MTDVQELMKLADKFADLYRDGNSLWVEKRAAIASALQQQAAEIERWKKIADANFNDARDAIAQRDALKAKLDEAEKQEPVASIYIDSSGNREMDDWKCELPEGRNLLYTRPIPSEDVNAGLVEALKSALKTAEFEKHPYRAWHKEARAALSSAQAAPARVVPDGYVLVPAEALTRWRDAFAEELAAWDIDPPIHHVKASHDEIEAMLAAAPQPQEGGA